MHVTKSRLADTSPSSYRELVVLPILRAITRRNGGRNVGVEVRGDVIGGAGKSYTVVIRDKLTRACQLESTTVTAEHANLYLRVQRKRAHVRLVYFKVVRGGT